MCLSVSMQAHVHAGGVVVFKSSCCGEAGPRSQDTRLWNGLLCDLAESLSSLNVIVLPSLYLPHLPVRALTRTEGKTFGKIKLINCNMSHGGWDLGPAWGEGRSSPLVDGATRRLCWGR